MHKHNCILSTLVFLLGSGAALHIAGSEPLASRENTIRKQGRVYKRNKVTKQRVEEVRYAKTAVQVSNDSLVVTGFSNGRFSFDVRNEGDEVVRARRFKITAFSSPITHISCIHEGWLVGNSNNRWLVKPSSDIPIHEGGKLTFQKLVGPEFF